MEEGNNNSSNSNVHNISNPPLQLRPVENFLNEIRNELNSENLSQNRFFRSSEFFMDDYLEALHHDSMNLLFLDEDDILVPNSDSIIDYGDLSNNYHNRLMSITKENREKYGKLTVQTFRKLVLNRLIILTPLNDKIYKKIIEIFHRNFEKNVFFVEIENNDKNEKLKKFLNCLPNLTSILKEINNTNLNDEKRKNDLYYLKLCLDIYYKFYKSEDILSRYFSSSFKMCLNLLIKFYNKISPERLRYIHDRCSNDGIEKFNLLNYKSSDEYLEHFIREKTNLLLISEGAGLGKFIN